MSDRYTGPVCWVPLPGQWVPTRWGRFPRGKRWLEGGWHYSTRRTRFGETPTRRLHLNQDDPADPFYETAKRGHRSHVEKHGVGRIVQLPPLPEGVTHMPENYDDEASYLRMIGR